MKGSGYHFYFSVVFVPVVYSIINLHHDVQNARSVDSVLPPSGDWAENCSCTMR